MLSHRNYSCRTIYLRARNRPLGDFFTFLEAPQQGGGPSQGPTQPIPDNITLIPPASQRRERTHATDIDSEGRRGGGPDPDNAIGDLTEKDVLPAYEVKGGPPNYGQFVAVDLGTSTNASLQATETVPAQRSPQSSQLLEASPGTSYPSIQTSSVLGVWLPPPPPPSYNPGTPPGHPSTYHVPADR